MNERYKNLEFDPEKFREGEEVPAIYTDERVVSQLTGIAVQTLRNDRCMGRGFPYYKEPGRRMVRYFLPEVFECMRRFRVAPGEV